MAPNSNINRGIQLIIDFIDMNVKRKKSGRYVIRTAYEIKVVQIIKCTCFVFIDNFRNISANSST